MSSHTVRVGESVLTLRDVVPDDALNVLLLHTHVFGPGADARWFEWKYGQASNQGHGLGVGAWHDGQLVAFCGGVPRALWLHQQKLQGLQIGDVMVHPGWRGILSRQGPFFQVSKRFYDSKIGTSETRPFELGFGFPNERHLRLAVLLGLLHDGGTIQSLRWNSLPAAEFDLPWFWQWQPLYPSDPKFDDKVNAAWKRMQVDVGSLITGNRDAVYLRWRFVNRPKTNSLASEETMRYSFFELRNRWSGTGNGIAVMDLISPTPHWLDWIGPLGLMPAASRACRMETARAGAAELIAWASQAVADLLVQTDVKRYEICAGLGIPVSSDARLQNKDGANWWLMGGDTDFL